MAAGSGHAAALGAGVFAAALAGCTIDVNTDGAVASETHRFAVTGEPTVALDTFDGAIEVHAWERPEVEVVVEKQAPDDARLKQITIEQSQQGDTIRVRALGPASSGRGGVVIGVSYSPRARLRVAVPKATTLDLRSGDGSITVEATAGPAALRTDDGAIIVSRLSGALTARTGDGAIRAREITGGVDVETGDGSVAVTGTLTHLRVRTGDGSVRVGVEDGSRVEDDWAVETGDGSVEVRLPEALDVVVDAATSDGSVRSNHPGLRVEPREAGDDGAGGELRATLGSGGRTLRVRTRDGTIRFER